MGKSRKLLMIILYSALILLAVGSILSVFRNTESRYLKMLDFPRIQFFTLSLFSLGIFKLTTKRWHRYDFAIIAGLLIGLFVNGFFLIDYTGLVPAKEKEHVIDAYSFELGKCNHDHIKERMLWLLAQIDDGLSKKVAGNLGMEIPNDIERPINRAIGADAEIEEQPIFPFMNS
ncbi:catalase-related domain-containing protein [Pricia sp.]|uniref:catalase-related domain-containing protein n=1 Tax=Pricia sp. TaxID=2268138 RepID=UPI003593376C